MIHIIIISIIEWKNMILYVCTGNRNSNLKTRETKQLKRISYTPILQHSVLYDRTKTALLNHRAYHKTKRMWPTEFNSPKRLSISPITQQKYFNTTSSVVCFLDPTSIHYIHTRIYDTNKVYNPVSKQSPCSTTTQDIHKTKRSTWHASKATTTSRNPITQKIFQHDSWIL